MGRDPAIVAVGAVMDHALPSPVRRSDHRQGGGVAAVDLGAEGCPLAGHADRDLETSRRVPFRDEPPLLAVRIGFACRRYDRHLEA